MKPRDLAAADLTPGQRRLLEAIAGSSLAGTFYLSGGTALGAFYLQHRRSRDLNLFTPDDVRFEVLRSFLDGVPGVEVRAFQRLYDRRIFILAVDAEPLEVEFTRYPFPRIEPAPSVSGAFAIDDLRDLAANKVAALADRFEPKDEVDLYFLLRSGAVGGIVDAVELAQKKFGTPGLRGIVERRLLAVAASHPSTTPPVSSGEIARAFREAARELVRRDLDE